MTPRARVVLLTAAAAAASAAVVVFVVATRTERPAPLPSSAFEPRAGLPPLGLDLGVRADAEAAGLRRAQALYEQGDTARAATIFDRYDSLEARVGQAYAAWPERTVDRLTQLAGLHPRSATVQLHLGVALYWARRRGAEEAWRAAVEAEPDSPYAVAAGNLLFPGFARGLPRFVPSESLPGDLDGLPPGEQLDALRRRANGGERLATLYYGVALQRLGQQLSARRLLAAYARRHPGDAEAQVAAAVARFDKARPVEAFSRLGPLTRRFPQAAVVRFHLGLLLLWSGQLDEATRQLTLAQKVEPRSVHAREAGRYLAELRKAGA